MIIIIPKFTYLIDIKDESLNSHSFLYKITDKNTDLTRIFVRTNKDIKIEAIKRYMIEFQYPGNFEKNHFDENLRLETIFYRIFICKLQWLLCYYLLSFV